MSLAEDHFSEQTTLSFLINYLIMKSFLKKMVAVVSLVVAMVANVEAQNSFAYQAVIRTAKGELVSSKEIGMQFSLIYDGKVIYCETQKPTTNQYGSVQVEVGKGQKVSGSFADVPWSTMQVMMKIEADPNGGTSYIDLGTIQLQPAPYAMYAPAAGKVTTIQAGDPKSDSDALFEVKDKDGNVVFAVYPDGVRVFVDDSDSTVTKAISTGFAVSGRKAAKEGEEANIFAVNAQGTQVFVNEEDTAGGKAMQTGFAVSGRKAAKDGSDLFTVGSTGTQVYIDEDATKAISTGFAVSGRKGADKGDDKYLEINTDGTHVYIDNEDDSTKAVRTGFAVSGRRGGAKDAAKYMEINADGTKVYVGADGKAMPTGFAVSGRRGAAKGKEIKLFEVNSFGTQIYIDAENTKAQRTGFAVSGRRGAAKDGSTDSNQDKYMVIDADGTVIYVDYEAAKAMQTGFAVSGRKAAKDGTPNTILKVDNTEGTHIYIEDVDGKVMPTGFAVSGRKAAKDGESDLMRITGDKTTITAKNLGMQDKESDKSMMSITSDSTIIFTDDLQLLNHNDSTLLTTNNGNVEVMNDLVVLGDVAQTVDADTVEDVLPIYMAVVERIDTIVCADTAPGLQAAKGYALLKIYGNGLFAQNQNVDAEGNNVILFDANGNPIQQHQAAAAAVILTKASTADAKLIVWPLKQVNNLKICFGLMAAGDTANRYVNVEAYVNASAPVECLVDVKAEVDSLGTVVVNGPKVYGEKVDLVPQPVEGYHFTKWADGRQANPRTALILHDTAFASANFEINTYNIIAKAKNGKVEISGDRNADSTFNHGTNIILKAIPFENHHFMGWNDGDTAKLRQFTIKSDTTFEALFAIDSFNIKLQAKNGTVAGEGVYPYGTEIEISATADTAAGYHFVNWSDNIDDNPRKLTVTDNMELTANFAINTYALTYKVDGEIFGDVETVEYGAPLTLRDSLVKEGYTFIGWSAIPETMPKNNVTVTGSWSINQYTITFKSDTNVVYTTVKQDYNTTFDMPKEEPVKTGYTFKGWSDTLTAIPAKDTTITAKWEINKYTITYKVGNTVYETIKDVEYNTSITAITMQDKEGYTFIGWSYNGSAELPKTMPDADVEISGSYEINRHTITYKVDGAIFKTIEDVAYDTQITAIDGPSKEGYDFSGWSNVPSKMPDADVEISGTFSKKTFQIKFDVNGVITEKTYQYDETPSYDDINLTKESTAEFTYTFEKWEPVITKVTADQTYVAKFKVERAKYTLKFMDGENVVETRPVENGSNISAPTDNLTKEGYVFAGWATTANATTTESVAATMPTNDLTYYAVWFNAQLASSATTFYKGSTLSVSAAFKTNNGSAYMPDTEQLSWQLALKTLAGTAVEGTTTTADASSASLTIPVTTTLTEGQYILHAVLNYNGTRIGEADFVVTAVEGMVAVKGATVSGPVGTGDAASKVFIDGRTVTIHDLYVSDHEVTQAEYQAVMGTNPSHFTSNPYEGEVQNNRPVEMVNWYDALVYCNTLSIKEGLTPCYSINGSTNPADWGDVPTSNNDATWDGATCNFDANGYRLPTEAEWEYVARGGNGGIPEIQTIYSGSDNIDDVAWYGMSETTGISHAVKKKNPNTLGIYDMTGNIWEWCWDKTNKLDGADDNVTPIVSSTSFDGVGEGDKRVGRGGCWIFNANLCGVAYRRCNSPVWKYQDVGFRVVRTANAEPTTNIFIGGDNANDDNTGLTVNSPLATIAAAASKMNDVNNTNYTIYVNGTLTGMQSLGGNLNGKAAKITLCGLNGNSTDILDGNNSGTVLTINTTVPVTIKNLKISGGNATNGGGIYCSAGSDVTLDNGAKVAGNIAQEKGGGVYVDGKVISNDTIRGKLTINKLADISDNNVVVVHSSGDDGGAGVYVNYGMMLLNGGEISNNYHGTSSGNSFTSTTVNGRGGIRLQYAIFTMRDGKISGNKSGHMGGNIFSVASRIDICGGEISDGVIGYNNSSYDAVGSALLLDIKTVLNMSGGKIIGNKTWAGQNKTGRGAVVVCNTSIFNMSGGTISGNTIESGGNRYGSAVCVIDNGVFNISDSANIASNNDVYLAEGKMITIAGKLTADNVATITPDVYTNNRTILALDNNAQTNLLNEVGKFRLTNSDWRISTDGKLLSKDFVQVPGAYFTGAATVASSGVFVQGTQITIPNLLVCNHEVTQSEWQTVMDVSQSDINSSYLGDDKPAYQITWYAAIAYCNKRSVDEGLTPVYSVSGIANWKGLTYDDIPKEDNVNWNAVTCNFDANGYRLPTEAEWEYLARGGNLTNNGQMAYSGSNDIGDVAWYKSNSSGHPHDVKTKMDFNRLGLYDMSGNVWEWCWEPALQSATHERHTRGGSWDCSENSEWCNVNTRAVEEPYEIKMDMGLRVVRTVSQLGMVHVEGATVSDQVSGSLVFNGRTITIPNLIVSDHEVTQFEYQAVMGTNPSQFISNPAEGEVQENRPVENVSWYDALVYCNTRSIAEGLTPCYTISGSTIPAEWGTVPTSNNSTWNSAICDFNANGYRLPTEAEWEYLARGGNKDNYTYSGNDDASKVAWFDDANGQTHEVKKLLPNALGLYDMSGNVWEWCWDWYDYPIENTTPSTGPGEGLKRCLRGGCWKTDVSNSEVDCRGYSEPKIRSSIYGFRVVRSASANIYVGGGTSSNPTGLTPNDAFATIADAANLINTINNPMLDYTIYINGTLNGAQTFSADLNGKASSITICGLNGLDGDGVPQDKLVGYKSSTELTINTIIPVIISKLQITDGYAANGGGINMCRGSRVTLSFGALVGEAATSVATESSYANQGMCGGGIYNGGGNLILGDGSMVCHNYALADYSSGEQAGAGISCYGGTITVMAGAKVIYNYSSARGGGIALYDGAQLYVNGGNIDNNEAKGWGGGVFFSNNGDNPASTKMVMTGGSVSGNSVTGKVSSWNESGGGIYIDCGTVTVSGNAQINNNSATVQGGGVGIGSGTFDMHGGILSGNTVDERGGAISYNTENANFQIGDSAYIPCSGLKHNDVCLLQSSTIKVTSELKCTAPVATITPESYSRTTPVLQIPDNADNSLKAEFGKFAVIPVVSGSTLTSWSINSEGKLQEGQSHTFVDLGLQSGNLWATCNVGASSPEEYGDYFAWGETEPYYSSLDPLTWKEGKENGCVWASYTKLSDGASSPTFSKYNSTDGKTTLEPADDAATVNWGLGWSTPTEAEYQELLDNCSWSWKDNYNNTSVNGYLFTSQINGKQIFFPAAGGYSGADNGSTGTNGFYWTASIYNSDFSNVNDLNFGNTYNPYVNYPYTRFCGFPVRPVKRP